MQQDEIYLIDLWRLFAREWRSFMLVVALCLAATFAFAHVAKRQWEATAWILIGQVGQAPAGQDAKVEPLLRVIERLQLEPFQDEVLRSAGLDPEGSEAKLYRRSLKLEPMPYAGPLVRLSLRAGSPQQARQLAAATVAHLQAVHQQLEALPLQQARARLQAVQSDLQAAQAERAQLQQDAGDNHAANGKGGSDTSRLLANMLLTGKDGEIRGLRQARDDLADRLSPAYTYDTSLMWPVYVPERAASPNALLIWGGGLVLGVFAGAFAAVARNAARRRTQGRAALAG